MKLERYSIGMGDRFAHQAKPQLNACIAAAARGVDVVPVWNKSFREHSIVASHPDDVRNAAANAVKELGWKQSYYVDADHINLANVDGFIGSSDFFTIDVAEAIGKPVEPAEVARFLSAHPELPAETAAPAAARYLAAVREAGQVYRAIAARKSAPFVTEISMDETGQPQTPPELMLILAAIADENIPVQTIAPKFTGRFNKGVDFVGDPAGFEREFTDDVAVIEQAVKRYSLPKNLKLSVHSGSDKFSIYPAMRRILARTGAGLHLKTAGTTWLEELIGLAESAGDGLDLAKQVYAEAYADRDALCAPYAAVIDIDAAKLPAPAVVNKWRADEFVGALRHDPTCPLYNSNLRQLLHVGYKVAAKMGERYTRMLGSCEQVIARNVTGNLLERHILRVFPRKP